MPAPISTEGVRCRHCKTRKAACRPCGMLTRRGCCERCANDPDIREKYALIDAKAGKGGPTLAQLDELVASREATMPPATKERRGPYMTKYVAPVRCSHRKRR